MGGRQSKKASEEKISQLERRIDVLDNNMKSSNTNVQKMKNKQVKANSRIDTLEIAETVLGTNLRSLSDKVDSLTDCMVTFKSEAEETRSRLDHLIVLMVNSEETMVEQNNLLRSVLRNINQLGQERRVNYPLNNFNQYGEAPFNLHFENRADQDDTESDAEQ